MLTSFPRAFVGRIVLALTATVLAGGVALFIWTRWYYADADTYEESVHEHVAAYSELRPGGPFHLASFPSGEHMSEVPTYTVHINQRFFREREFDETPASGVRRIFAVGDSATFGTGVESSKRFTEVLHGLLEEEAPGQFEVLNVGWVGTTTAHSVETVRNQVLKWSPSVLVVNGGANDLRSPEHPMAYNEFPKAVAMFEAKIREIIALCRGQGIEVVLWANSNADHHKQRFLFGRLRESLQKVSEAEGVPLVDLEEVFNTRPATSQEQRWFLEHQPWTSFNGISLDQNGIPIGRAALHNDWMHPNRFGHRRLGEALFPHVLEALARAEENTAGGGESPPPGSGPVPKTRWRSD